MSSLPKKLTFTRAAWVVRSLCIPAVCKNIFGSADDAQALGLYRWNDDLSAVWFQDAKEVATA